MSRVVLLIWSFVNANEHFECIDSLSGNIRLVELSEQECSFVGNKHVNKEIEFEAREEKIKLTTKRD